MRRGRLVRLVGAALAAAAVPGLRPQLGGAAGPQVENRAAACSGDRPVPCFGGCCDKPNPKCCPAPGRKPGPGNAACCPPDSECCPYRVGTSVGVCCAQKFPKLGFENVCTPTGCEYRKLCKPGETKCGEGVCCPKGQKCADPKSGFCCPNSTKVCSSLDRSGSPITKCCAPSANCCGPSCCPAGVRCTDRNSGTCGPKCPRDRPVACGNRCCKKGSACIPGGCLEP